MNRDLQLVRGIEGAEAEGDVEGGEADFLVGAGAVAGEQVFCDCPRGCCVTLGG